jgi:predicted nucleic acid-binding protein
MWLIYGFSPDGKVIRDFLQSFERVFHQQKSTTQKKTGKNRLKRNVLSCAKLLIKCEQLEAFPCLPIDGRFVKIAAETSERFRLSYWDGAIVAAAELLGAKLLYTEDLNNGQRYGIVEARNPFLKGSDRERHF